MVEDFDNVLAIIPARRESKRLPGKNKMQLSAYYELWQHAVLNAKGAEIKNICVSTDDTDILDKIALSNLNKTSIWGFKRRGLLKIWGLNRSPEMAEDDATMGDVIREVMQQISQYGLQYDTICLLQPTSPLLSPSTLKHALHQYYSHKYPGIVAVNRHYSPCGAFYILNKNSFNIHANIWMPGLAVYVVDEKEAIDIDHIWDFRIADAVHRGWVEHK